MLQPEEIWRTALGAILNCTNHLGSSRPSGIIWDHLCNIWDHLGVHEIENSFCEVPTKEFVRNQQDDANLGPAHLGSRWNCSRDNWFPTLEEWRA